MHNGCCFLVVIVFKIAWIIQRDYMEYPTEISLCLTSHWLDGQGLWISCVCILCKPCLWLLSMLNRGRKAKNIYNLAENYFLIIIPHIDCPLRFEMYQSEKVYIQHYCGKKTAWYIFFNHQYVLASGFINRPLHSKIMFISGQCCVYTKYIYIHGSCIQIFCNVFYIVVVSFDYVPPK